MPGIAYTLGMNSGPAVAGVRAFEGALGGLKSTIGKVTGVLGVLGISFAAFKGASSFFDSLKGVMEAGKELNTMRAVTGQTIAAIVTMKKAFGEAGIAPEALEGSLVRLQKSLGGVNEEGRPTGHIFTQLRLSISKLKGEDAVQQFREIGAAINKLGSDSDRTFATMEVFGREGAPLKALFADSHLIDEAGQSMAKYAGIMERDAGMFKDITNALESLHSKVKGFFVGFADKIGPVLLPLLQKLKDSMGFFVGMGQQVGGEIAAISKSVYGLFKNGNLSEAAGLELRVGFADAVDFLAKKLDELWKAVEKDAPDILKSLTDGMGGMQNIFKGLGVQMGAAIVTQLADVLSKITVMGHSLISAQSAANIGTVAKGYTGAGEALVTMGVEEVQHGSGKGGLAGNIGKLTSAWKGSLDESRARLKILYDKADDTANKNKVGVAPVAPVMRKDTGGNALQRADMSQIEKFVPMSDRLAKIGLFIGGNGGVKGEKAQQDTAKNTAHIAETLRRTNEILLNHKPSGHAIF